MTWRNSKEYRKWRAQVIRRDKVCQICGSRKRRTAHHLNHATYFKDKRFDINNGVTLCSKCHSIFHNSFKRNTRQKCTEYDFNQFKELATYFKSIYKENNE